MAIQKLHERHFVVCALCPEEDQLQQFTSLKLKTEWLTNHARGTHWKRSAYTPDAMQSVTVLYEKAVPDSDQDSDATDPTDAFLFMIQVLREQELL